MITFNKLQFILDERKIKRKELIEEGILSGATLAKLSKGKTVSTESVDRICEYLNVQPGDIMAYEPETKEEKERRKAKTKAKSQKDMERMKQRMKDDIS